MKKSHKIFWLIGLSLILEVSVSCEQPIDGHFYGVEEAYNLGYISKEDLYDLSFYYNHPSKEDYETYNKPILTVEDIDKTIVPSLKNTYIEEYCERYGGNPSPDDVRIIRYYGKYNNLYAVRMILSYIIIDPIYQPIYYIDGVQFNYFVNSVETGIALWKANW